MYLIDTNIVSEHRKPRPNARVLAWHARTPPDQVFIAAITFGELQAGAELTRRQDPATADWLDNWIDDVVAASRIIAMDERVFRTWARLMRGKSATLGADGMIAATAVVHRLTVVTRNARDFEPFGVPTFNPFV